jgi:hypothetical protein
MNNIKEYYWTQKHHAKDRGIDWQFTYDTWLEWWGNDIAKRGQYKGQLVMARHNDTGPYHPSNCRKATVEENIIEGQIGNSNAAKRIKTPIGVFNSRIEAAKAYGVNVSTIRKRLLKNPIEYCYLD